MAMQGTHREEQEHQQQGATCKLCISVCKPPMRVCLQLPPVTGCSRPLNQTEGGRLCTPLPATKACPCTARSRAAGCAATTCAFQA